MSAEFVAASNHYFQGVDHADFDVGSGQFAIGAAFRCGFANGVKRTIGGKGANGSGQKRHYLTFDANAGKMKFEIDDKTEMIENKTTLDFFPMETTSGDNPISHHPVASHQLEQILQAVEKTNEAILNKQMEEFPDSEKFDWYKVKR